MFINKMTQIELFFLLFSIFLIGVGASIVGAYFPSQKMWIKYTNNCFTTFNIKKMAYIIKEHKYKYISSFIFFSLQNCIVLTIFLLIWIKMAQDLYQSKNIILIIPFLIIFVFSEILIFILFKKFWKQLKKIGFYSKEEAIIQFKNFQKENESKSVKNFTLLKFDQNTIQDKPFQFQQKRYKKKIKNLTKKKIKQEKYDLELLNAFIKYLKVYAIFLTRIKTINEYSIIIENEKEIDILKTLPNILINNFFAFIKEAEKELNK